MKAVVLRGNEAVFDANRSRPQIRPDHVLVKVVAVALNPTDWKGVRAGRAKDGSIIGCDYAGVVEEVGSAVTKPWKAGDRIFGIAHGTNFLNPDDGVFAEYAAVVGDLQMRIPDSLTFQQAATVGLGAMTVGQGLYQHALKLDLPSADANEVRNKGPSAFVLIYGGSTATGALAIQFAKLSGYTVITTCSKRNFDYVKGLGADHVIDYNDNDVAAQIRDITNNTLAHAWDTVSVNESAKICADALSSTPGLGQTYGAILPVNFPRTDVKTVNTIMYTVFGKFIQFGKDITFPASQEDYDFGKEFLGLVEKLLDQGRLKPHHQEVRDGGLEGIIQGLNDLEQGKVRGAKLVYNV